jgi:hypothetical protein
VLNENGVKKNKNDKFWWKGFTILIDMIHERTENCC